MNFRLRLTIVGYPHVNAGKTIPSPPGLSPDPHPRRAARLGRAVTLPVVPPISPMLAKSAKALPERDGLIYEPKWDGFRSIVFRDGDDLEFTSRNERPLTRYFPELFAPLQWGLPEQCVLDGEIVIVGDAGLDFDALLQRIHPAVSRINRLAAETPASFVAFDLLALGNEDLRTAPFSRRRELLETILEGASGQLQLTPATTDIAMARDWFNRFEGAGLDGIVAKDPALPYLEGERVMTKVKHERTADCVVGGYRLLTGTEDAIGSLLLGLYDDSGTLQHVGVTSSFTKARRVELFEELQPLVSEPGSAHPWAQAETSRRPDTGSRWNAGRDLSFVAMRPELVCEVAYDHLQGDRFRHATTFRRFRPDRTPTSCTYAQLEAPVAAELSALARPTE